MGRAAARGDAAATAHGPVVSRIPVLHGSDDIAAVGGEIAASAERRGRPRPQELGLICEPVSGFEPLTCRLQDGCSAD